MDGRWDDIKGVPGRGKLMERTTLGSFARKLEWVSTRAGKKTHAYREGGFFRHRMDKALGVREILDFLH